MVGSAPIFYNIVLTEKLLHCIYDGIYPSEETVVLKYVPPVPVPAHYQSFGIRPLENRRIVFQCLEAFKSLIVSLQNLLLLPTSQLLSYHTY